MRIVLNAKGDRAVVLGSPFELAEDLKALPGALWNKKLKAWHVPATPMSVAGLHAVLEGLGATATPAVGALLVQARTVEASADRRYVEDLPEVPNQGQYKCWLHQKQAYWFGVDMHASMLALPMGLGKSKVAVNITNNNEPGPILVTSPLSAVGVWPREFERHGEGHPYSVLPLAGMTVAKRTKKAEEHLKTCRAFGKVPVFVINHESLWRAPFSEWALTVDWERIIFDESHRLRDPGTKVSKFAYALGKKARHRNCLTGTPFGQSPLTVFPQYRYLDAGVYGTSKQAFERTYAAMETVYVPGGRAVQKPVGIKPEMRDEFYRKFYTLAVRVSADVLDLPPVTDQHIPVTMEPKEAAAYKQMEKELLVELDNATLEAANAMVKVSKLQQIVAGHCKYKEDEWDAHPKTATLGHSKEKALEDLIEGMDAPVAVFCNYREDLVRIRAVAGRLKRSYAEISGSEKSALNDRSEWEHGDVIGVQIQSGGTGIDLTRGRYGVYYTQTMSLTDYDQSRKRIHRPGQEHPVTYYHLVADGTIENHIYESLKACDATNRDILDDMTIKTEILEKIRKALTGSS